MEYNWIVEFFLVAVFLLSLLLLNHSCDPNIFTTIIDSNRIAVLANLPIKTSLQFFIENSSQFYSSDMKNYQELQIMSETKKAWENYLNWKLWSRVNVDSRWMFQLEKIIQRSGEEVRKVNMTCKHINKISQVSALVQRCEKNMTTLWKSCVTLFDDSVKLCAILSFKTSSHSYWTCPLK